MKDEVTSEKKKTNYLMSFNYTSSLYSVMGQESLGNGNVFARCGGKTWNVGSTKITVD